MDKIRQYIPKDIPVISPKGDEIQVSDSFFKEMLQKGYGRRLYMLSPNADGKGGVLFYFYTTFIP